MLHNYVRCVAHRAIRVTWKSSFVTYRPLTSSKGSSAGTAAPATVAGTFPPPQQDVYNSKNEFHKFFATSVQNNDDVGLSMLFKGMSTRQLTSSYVIFKLCSTQWLVGPTVSFLRSPVGEGAVGGAFRWMIKKFVFPHFCAGEDLLDCLNISRRFHPEARVKLMVDNSVEERESPDDWAINLENKSKLLKRCKDELGDSVGFVPIKMTALVSPSLLEELTSLIAKSENRFDDIIDPRPQLSTDMIKLLDAALKNMSELCAVAEQIGLPLLLDAEQSHRQDGMDYIARLLMASFNKPGKLPIIYNTYQMYMIGAGNRVKRDMNFAAKENFIFASKIVRGAYLVGEAERAAELHQPNPLLSSKSSTDDSYNSAIKMVLEKVAHDQKTTPAIVVATHNSDSVRLATDVMLRNNIPRNHPNIYFGQIMGMCDHLTNSVGLGGYNSMKCVLFGNFEDIFPWLLRRMDENRDLFGASQQGLPLLKSELAARRLATSALWKTWLTRFNDIHGHH